MKKFYLKTMAVVAYLLLGLSASAQVRGDVTGEGTVDIADVNAVINMMLGKTPQTAAGDVTGDNNVDIADVNAVINIMLGKNNQDESITTFTVNGVSFKMVAVEGGTFTMGATAEQGNEVDSNESPTHLVTLSSYSIGQTEVTQELWLAVMDGNPSYFQVSTDSDYGYSLQRPVERVSWDACQAFITKLNQMTGKTFRLPTEAEWEYAARGGNKSHGYKYAGSNTLDDVAWYLSTIPSQTSGTAGYGTQPVATKAPNELGLYDMSGNVEEWCKDWYDSYTSGAQTNPTGPDSGSNRVIRGGGWDSYYTSSCRVSRRGGGDTTYTSFSLGLRLAL